jgi:hypothetical protein
MPRNGLMNLIFNILAYLFIGYLAIAFFITVFPLLGIMIAVGAVAILILYLINYINLRPRGRKNVDEFGNRKTKVTILEMQEADNPAHSAGSAQPDQPAVTDNKTDSKNKN